ncbi:hypothetical protein DFP72DRAFT_749373, partial [Ephemerocybe angulata]
ELWLCRRIYTDACILSALVQDAAGKLLEAIGTLDYALIIAGAAGESRFEIIHGLIDAFQAPLREASPVVATNDGPEEPVEPLPTTLASSTFPIPRISEPSFLSFQSTQSKAPFIVPGYAQGWPALNEHPWRRASHLRAASGPGRVVPVEVGENYLSDKWNQVIMSWDAFLSSLDFEDQETCRVQVEGIQYLAQHNLFTQMPALEDDIEIPVYAYACLTSDGRVHQPPSNERQLVINSWLGPKGTISPPHTDPFHNLYVQVVGQKTVWLAPPCRDISRILSPPQTSSPLQNTSRCDIFAGEMDAEFATLVLPHAIHATLNPGDLLYIPAGWWHAMRSERTSFSLSFWF